MRLIDDAIAIAVALLIEDVIAIALLIFLPDNVLERFGIYKSLETIIRRREK